MKTRVLVLLLACVMLICVFAGCGNENGKTGDSGTTLDDMGMSNTEEAETEEPGPDIPAKNYGGVAVNVLQRGSPWMEEWNSEKESRETLSMEMYDRNAYIEEKYNVSFEYFNIDSNSKVRNEIQAGTAVYHFESYALGNLMVQAQGGWVHNLKDVPYLDFSRSWWYTDLIDELGVDGSVFMAVGASNLCAMYTATVTFYNQDIANNVLGSDVDFYQLVRDKKWTLDTMMAYGKEAYFDTTGDGYTTNDRYGVIRTGGSWYAGFYGSGLRFVIKDADGNLHYNSEDTRNVDAVQKIISYFNDPAYVRPFVGADEWKYFSQDGALFLLDFVAACSSMTEMQNDYGILPSPLYAEGDDYHTTFHYNNGSAIAIPVTVSEEDLEMVGAILEEANYLSYKGIWSEYYNVILKGRVARDPGSAEMLDIVFSNLSLDPSFLYLTKVSDTGSVDATIRNMISTNSTAVQSTLAGIKENAQIALDTAMALYRKPVDETTGS